MSLLNRALATLLERSLSASCFVIVCHSLTGTPLIACCPYPTAHPFTSQYALSLNHSSFAIKSATDTGATYEPSCTATCFNTAALSLGESLSSHFSSIMPFLRASAYEDIALGSRLHGVPSNWIGLF